MQSLEVRVSTRCPNLKLALLLSAFCALAVTSRAQAAAVILDWDAVTTNTDGSAITDLAGYTLYQATSSFNRGGVWISTTQAAAMAAVTKINANGAGTSLTVSNLLSGVQYFFRLTANNTSGMISGFNVDANNADVEVSTTTPAGMACDTNTDGSLNVGDVQTDINAALGVAPCTPACDIRPDGACNVTDVQRVINAVLGGPCVNTMP